MSDASAQIPVPQSASQLSENIGDVLASIRRLIAQDEAAEAAAGVPAARPVPAREEPQHPRPESPSRRRDILAEAQALTRRSEAAFGQSAAVAAPLTLGAADRVASLHAALPGRVAPGAARADQTTAPLVLTAPVAERAAAALPVTAAAPRFRPQEAAQGADAARDAADTKPEEKAVAMTTAAPSGANTIPAPAEAPQALPTPQPAAPAAATPPEPAPAGAIAAASGPAMSATPHVAPVPQQPALPSAAVPQAGTLAAAAAPAAPAAQAFVPQQPAPPSAAVPPVEEDEDCTAAILREMIRDVVRQELQGDPSGRMPGGLRSMIMREVAQVLTQGARAAR